MLFNRLVLCAVLVALLAGTLQWVVQGWHAVPIILAAEAYEGMKTSGTAEPPPHVHADAAAAAHTHEAAPWSPADGTERSAWTWVATVLHSFAMALLALVAMSLWQMRRTARPAAPRMALAVAAAGFLCLHLWPALGLPAEIPGMDAPALRLRQAWWLLAAGCAAAACAALAFGRKPWRWALAGALLALPFIVGAPTHAGDPLAGFHGQAHARLTQLGREFVVATTLVALAFWVALGALATLVFKRWLAPLLPAR